MPPTPQDDLTAFRRALLGWFRRHARDLPWRRTRDPYAVWISEVMLQQTQVATVVPYFVRFLSRFPDLASLAEADESQVMRLWEGLGYYRRARQAYAAARRIRAEHGGVFPRDAATLRRLPGFGRYTASAVASIAFDRREAVLEANTLRLYCRLLGFRGDPHSAAGQQALWSAAQSWIPRRGVGQFNQALMELGNLVCQPKAPRCQECPVAAFCAARRLGLIDRIPRPKRPPRREDVYEAAAIVQAGSRVLLVERRPGERWAGMWDFPRLATEAAAARQRRDLRTLLQQRFGLRVERLEPLERMNYGVTRFRIVLTCFAALMPRPSKLPSGSGGAWAPAARLSEFPMSATGRRLAEGYEAVLLNQSRSAGKMRSWASSST